MRRRWLSFEPKPLSVHTHIRLTRASEHPGCGSSVLAGAWVRAEPCCDSGPRPVLEQCGHRPESEGGRSTEGRANTAVRPGSSEWKPRLTMQPGHSSAVTETPSPQARIGQPRVYKECGCTPRELGGHTEGCGCS